jgi:serine/threonine protein kinase
MSRPYTPAAMRAPNYLHSEHQNDLMGDMLPDGTALGFAGSFVALLRGQTIARYEIISVLGRGVLGPTYRARDPDVGRDVVIKEFLPSALAVRSNGIDVVPRSPDMADEFIRLREHFAEQGRKLLALKRAPFVVRVLELIEANDTSYVVVDLVPGITLQHRLSSGRMGVPEVVRLTRPLLEGLQHMHEAGVLHGDIRPANILLGVSDRPMLIDFGATRAALPAQLVPAGSFSASGYAPPEQASRDEPGAASDLYGLAATLYRAITGTPPPDAIDRLRADTFKPLTEIAPPGFDRDFLAAVDKGLALHPGDRLQQRSSHRGD